MATREVYRGRIVHLTVEDATLPNGHVTSLEVVRHPGAAAVATLDDDAHVTLLRQYRHAAGGWLWEVPAGTLDPGEAPAACARRELEEEAGLAAGRLDHVGSIVTCPGFCDEVIHLFIASNLSAVPPRRSADEVIDTVERIPLREVLDMIRTGEIRDAKTIAALAQVALRFDDRGRPRN